VLGIFKYEGASNNEPNSIESAKTPELCNDLPIKNLIPYYAKSVPGPVNRTFNMSITFGQSPELVVLAFVNDESFKLDFNDPTIQKIIRGIDPNTLPANQNAFVFDEPNAVIEIRLFSK